MQIQPLPKRHEKLRLGGGRSMPIIAANRSGKGARCIINMLLSTTTHSRVSFFVLDPRGETAAVTAPYRATLGPVRVLNPCNVHADLPDYADLGSAGSSLIGDLNATAPTLFDFARYKAEATIPIEGDSSPFFPKSARGLWCGLLMGEVILAHRERRRASLVNVRAALTAPETLDPKTKEPTTGLRAHVRRLMTLGNSQLASLLGNFAGEYTDATRDVLQTCDEATQWILSTPIAADLSKPGPDFRELGDRVCTYYVILPHEMLETHSVWLRLVVSSALRALYRPRPDGVRCVMVLDEFASLGRLREIEMAQGLTAGFGIQLMPVLQSLTQLQLHYRDGWQNFLGQAGAVIGFGTNDHFTGKEFSDRSGETTIRSPNTGTSTSASGSTGASAGDAFTRRPYLLPQDFFKMPAGHAHVWAAGVARPIPAYLPFYWNVETLAQRARRNPYYGG